MHIYYMQDIKIEIPIILLFIDVLTQCLNERTTFILKKYDMLDKESKLDNE